MTAAQRMVLERLRRGIPPFSGVPPGHARAAREATLRALERRGLAVCIGAGGRSAPYWEHEWRALR